MSNRSRNRRELPGRMPKEVGMKGPNSVVQFSDGTLYEAVPQYGIRYVDGKPRRWLKGYTFIKCQREDITL